MSTKTTFKRVALVTVAAMGFGLLSVAPSTATSQTDTLAVSSATSTCLIAATTCSITLTQTMLTVSGDTMSVTASLSSNGNASSVAMPVMTNLIGLRTGDSDGENTGYPYVSADGLTGLNYDTVSSSNVTYRSVTAAYKVAFTPTHAGTFVVSFAAYNMLTGTTRSTVAAVAPAVTWTITVAALATAAAADASSTSITNSYGVATGSADKTIRIAAGSSLAGAATIVVISKVDDAVATGSSVVSASVSGPGTLDINQTSTGGTSTGFKTASFKALSGTVYVHLFADGQTGTSTITITVGGATKTETVYFYGAAASVTTTTTNAVIDSGSGAVSTAILTATVKDANGNVVPGATVYAISGTTTVFASTSATTGSAGTAAISVLGLTEGTSAVTVQNVATGSTATFSAAAVSIRSGQDLGASVVMSLDKATYTQGEAAILTVTVKDSSGNLVANGSNTPWSVAATSTRTVTGGLPGLTHVTTGSTDAANGSINYAINVPTTSGAFTISATAGSGWTGTFSATATVSASAAEIATAAAIAAAADIASAAVDAAAEATDAANAATDAANAAAEAADAATAAAQDAADAVASLATAVTELMADLKAQIAAQKAAITALTNLVIKIQKKIKA